MTMLEIFYVFQHCTTKTILISTVSNYISFKNTIVHGPIQDAAKLFASIDGRKLHGKEVSKYFIIVSCVCHKY